MAENPQQTLFMNTDGGDEVWAFSLLACVLEGSLQPSSWHGLLLSEPAFCPGLRLCVLGSQSHHMLVDSCATAK